GVAAGVHGRLDRDDDLVAGGHAPGAVGGGAAALAAGLVEDLGDLGALGRGDAQDGERVAAQPRLDVDGHDDLVAGGDAPGAVGGGVREGRGGRDEGEAGGDGGGEGVTECVAH